MRFLLDPHLPVRLAVHLRRLGHDVTCCWDIGLGGASDREIWRHAQADRRVVVTKDEDYLDLAARSNTGQVLWLRVGNCRNAVLLKLIDSQHEHIVSALGSGALVTEVRGS